MSDSKTMTAVDQFAHSVATQTAQAAQTRIPTGWSAQLVSELTITVFLFTALCLIVCAVLLWRDRANSDTVIRAVVIIAIVGSATTLLVIGYSNEQLTPIVGLFGAISGYLLGKDSKSSAS